MDDTQVDSEPLSKDDSHDCSVFFCSPTSDCSCWIPFSEHIDFDNYWWSTVLKIFFFRTVLCMTYSDITRIADENWQTLEMAYSFVYGDQIQIVKTWEWMDPF